MSTIVVYKSKYGSTQAYAQWIAEELRCEAVDAKDVKVQDLEAYDTIIYGGGLYAEVIAGVTLITKNFDKLADKNLFVYTTGITPLDCREYYDKMVVEKNFKPQMLEKIKLYHFLGKMVMEELSLVHRTALKSLKKIMEAKENPTPMEQLLVQLCEQSGDFSDRGAIGDLVDAARKLDTL